MTREHGRAAAPRALHLPVLLLAVLAGLFAMHGLGPHDDDHSSGHLPTVVALMTADEPVEHAGSAERAERAEHGEHPEDEGTSALGECLALLGLLFALVVGAALAGRPSTPVFVLRRVIPRLAPRGRPPDPPCLHRLSILRC